MPAETNITNAITNAASYVGNAALGGGYDSAITIDNRPLELLAGYTYAYNRDMWNKKQKDAADAAKQLGEITQYDLTSPITKDREVLLSRWNEMINKAKTDPSVLDFNKNPQGYIEWQDLKSKLKNDIAAGNGRTLMYKARTQAIANENNPALKSVMQRQLDEAVNKTSIQEPLTFQNYDTSIPTVEAPPIIKVSTGQVGDNRDVINEVAMPDVRAARNMAYTAANGLYKDVLDENSPEFKNLSPEDQQRQREDYSFKKASGKYFAADQAKYLTDMLNSYRNADGTLDRDKINSSNAYLASFLKTVDGVNDYLTNTANQIKAGVYTNKFGKPIKFGENLNESDYTTIDLSDGIQPEEIYFIQSMGKAKSASNELKIQETDNAIQKEGNQIKWAELGLDKDKFEQQKKQWEESQKGSQTQINGAMERASRIFADLKKLADKDGIITPDKIRQLNSEQLKYMGTEVPEQRDEDGKIISSGGFKPLDLNYDNSQYLIQLDDNGNIKILKPKTGKKNLDRTPSGNYEGQWDNAKSTNIFNIGTNILNEELKNAGSKELNSYWGVDVTGKSTSFTDKQENSRSSSSSSDKGAMTRRGKDGKTYTSTDGVTWTASDGTVVKLKK